MGARAFIRAGVACLLGIIACNTKDPGTPDENQPVESLAALSTELNLQFPGSSRLVGVSRAKGIDDIVQVKIELAAQDLPSLVDQTQIDPGLFFPGTAGLLGSDRGFWDPNAAPALRTGQAKRPGGRALNLGIDDSRADVAVVYIVEHGT